MLRSLVSWQLFFLSAKNLAGLSCILHASEAAGSVVERPSTARAAANQLRRHRCDAPSQKTAAAAWSPSPAPSASPHNPNAPHSSRRSPQFSAVPRTHDCPLNVVIPMGGLGRNEFTNAGYPTPKPMIPVVGRPMLFWLLDNLDLRDTDAVWLGSKRDVEAEYGIEAAVRREYPSLEVHFVRFDFDTRGATETLYCVLNAMDANQRRRRTISLDCDTLWFCDVLGGARAHYQRYGSILLLPRRRRGCECAL